MGLITYSDPGFAGHAGEAISASQQLDQAIAEEELTRAKIDGIRAQGEADLERLKMADRSSRERAARNLGIAVDELASLGIDPSDVSIADDWTFLAEHAPDLAQQALAAFPDPSQRSEARLFLSKTRRAIEQGQSRQKKEGLYSSFMLKNQELASMSTGGGEGAGTKAENPLITQLRDAAQSDDVDSAAFEAQLRRVEDELERQTIAQIEHEMNLSKAQELWGQFSGGLTPRKRAEGAAILAKIKHSSTADASRLMMDLTLLMHGHEEEFARAMEENARAAVQQAYALQKHDEAVNGRQGARPAAAAAPGAQVTGPNGLGPGKPELKHGGVATGKPAESQDAAVKNIQSYIQSKQTGRGLLHMPTLLAYAAEQLGRPVTREELREILRGVQAAKEQAKRDELPEVDPNKRGPGVTPWGAYGDTWNSPPGYPQ